MTSAVSSSLSGLRSATRRLNVAAENIVTGQVDRPVGQDSNVTRTKRVPRSGGPVRAGFNPGSNLSSGIVDLKLAEISYRASAKALKVAMEIDKNFIDQVR